MDDFQVKRTFLAILTVVLLACHPASAQTDTSEADTTRAAVPEGMMLIPGGAFEMGISEEDIPFLAEMGRKVPHMSESHAKWWFGDEIPSHPVEIGSFYLDAYEVTNEQFARFVEETGYEAEGDWEKHAKEERMDHPVVYVTWNDASAYAKWAGKRLPTEAEWEHAARGGKDVKWFPWGDSPDPTRANYRYKGESFFAGIGRLLGLRKMNTKAVGSYKPNGFGLYDMCGNVSEWCENERKPYPGGTEEDGTYTRYGPFKKNQEKVYGKAVRGGSWQSPNPVFVRLTGRGGFEPDHSANGLGFRCAKNKEKKNSHTCLPAGREVHRKTQNRIHSKVKDRNRLTTPRRWRGRFV